MQKQLIHKIIKIIINDNPNFVFDSRIVKKGDIFIGIKTNNDNGSNYVDAALKKGCSLAIIDKKILHKNILYSPNVIKLLKSISIEILKNYKGKIIAVTGSVGKTTIKENIFYIFNNEKIKSYKSYKNHNNELGLIFNILNMNLKTAYSIFEVGISQNNEMKILTSILNPHYVLITNIEDSHIGNFGSYKKLMENKLLLLKSNRLISGLINFNKSKKLIPVFYKLKNNIEIVNIEKDITINKIAIYKNKSKLNFDYNNNNYLIESESNSKISFNIAILSFLFIRKILMSFKFINFFYISSFLQGHGNIIKVDNAKKKYLIFDHSYNASPFSMKENLNSFLNNSNYDKNNFLIIGSMKELGHNTLKYHIEIINLLKLYENTFFIGEEFFKLLSKDNPHNLKFYKTYQEFLPIIKKYINNPKKIFIMGSRSNNLDIVVRELC